MHLRQPHVTARTEDAIAVAVCAAAELLKVPLIVCLTSSGFTARTVASYRPTVPILAVTPEEETFRQLALVWGVIPALIDHYPDYDKTFPVAQAIIRKMGLAEPGDRVVVTAGVPFDVAGTTNLLKIETVIAAMRLTLLGTGTSFGVPQIGCDCAVCRSADPRDRRTRTAALIEAGEHAPDRHAARAPAPAPRAGHARLDAVLYTHEHADHVPASTICGSSR